MNTCQKCGRFKQDVTSYAFYYGQQTSQKVQEFGYETQITSRYSMVSEPCSVLICDGCIRNSILRSIFLNPFSIAAIGLLLFAIYGVASGMYNIVQYEGDRSSISWMVLFAGIAMAVGVFVYLPPPYDRRTLGERLAIRMMKPHLERKGFGKFFITAEYSEMGFVPTDIEKLKTNRDISSLVNVLEMYGRGDLRGLGASSLARKAADALVEMAAPEIRVSLNIVSLRLQREKYEQMMQGKGPLYSDTDSAVQLIEDTMKRLEAKTG